MADLADYCVFSLRNRRFGLPLAVVNEIVSTLAAAPVPWAPACLLGLVQLRGQILPRIELSSFLGALPALASDAPQEMVVAASDFRFIAPVDRMDIRSLDPATFTPHPASSLYPSLESTADTGEEKIELLHLDRLRCALQRELRFAQLTD